MHTPKNVILFRPDTTKTSSTAVEDQSEKPVYTRQQLEKVALRFCLKLHVQPDENYCALLLGDSLGDTNQRAIVKWILHAMEHLELISESELFDALAKHLSRETLPVEF